MKFRDIPKEATKEWALTVNANDLTATKNTYCDYIEHLQSISEELKYYYETGSKDNRLHIHCYVLLKKAKTKFAMNKIFKRPEGWSIDFSHVYDKDGWIDYITKDNGEIVKKKTHYFDKIQEEENEPTDEERMQGQALHDLINSLEHLFPDAQLSDIFTEEYSIELLNLFENI